MPQDKTAVERPDANARIAAWEKKTRWVIVFAALSPFLVGLISPASQEYPIVVDLLSWTIFFVDFIVHLRIKPRYWRTGRGIFDLAILLLTFPWYIFPGVGDTAFMAVFRVARLLRLVLAGNSGHKVVEIFRRLGGLGLALTITSLIAAVIVLRAEPPSSGFADFGDALWWSMVSFTTVGYGDLFPTTPAGRLAGVLMMLMGLAALGTVSGVLASFLSKDAEEPEQVELDTLHEVKAMRAELADLRSLLAERGGASGQVETAPNDPAGASAEDEDLTGDARSREDSGGSSPSP